MKKLFSTRALCAALTCVATPASARGVIVYSNGEKIEVVQKVPAEVLFEELVDEHVNIGVMYNQFSIMWIPMWNYGETVHVLVNDAEDTYTICRWKRSNISTRSTDWISLPRRASVSGTRSAAS